METILLKSKPIVEAFHTNFKPLTKSVRLDIVLIGGDLSSKIYVTKKIELAEKIGIKTQLHEFSDENSQDFLMHKIKKISDTPEVNGIIIQLPIHEKFNVRELYNQIDPMKDIESLCDANVSKREYGQKTYLPATAKAVETIFNFYNINITGKHVVMIGNSDIVGKPIATMCLQKNATVTICHEHTQDLQAITKTADIIIVAIGKPKYITEEYVRHDKTQILIDIGITDIGLDTVSGKRKVCGDVDFEGVKDLVQAITPVPGGVGPITVLSLIENLLESVV